ncbi:MAG: ABC transporter ATP-binding protein [Treponema sp.]|nr:ABC transporter ATP-binding protein [Treponema sp.]
MTIILKNLTKRFPGRGKDKTEVTAVDDFDFEIPDGKLIALLGPSGCGKSTTLYMIAGLLEPTEGKIFFGENDVTKLPTENRGVGLVFQNYALYPHLSVAQNIAFPLENLKGKEKLSKEEIKNRVEEAARVVQIEKFLERKPKELSGGQQQRVAIARALVKRPPVLLLDEPLSNLDARLRLQTREELRRIQKETGITTIFVTHDQDEAMSISDMIVVMKDGAVQQVGKPQEVYDNPANLFVAKFLGTPPVNVMRSGHDGKKCFMAVRPEGMIIENGQLTMDNCIDENGLLFGNDGKIKFVKLFLERVETQGRDTTLLLKHPDSESGIIRAIVDSDDAKNLTPGEITLGLKENKVYWFSEEGERL